MKVINFNNKQERKEYAKNHTNNMVENYGKEIQYSIDNTFIYDVDFKGNEESKEENKTTILVEKLDSVAAIIKYANLGKIAILNFASYKNPGGGFINGSKAQEESLCYNSFLYNVLKEFEKDFYEWNRVHLNKSLYLNRALYSKDILFFNEDKTKEVYCDVITCPAPNKKAALEYSKVSNKENYEVLESRIKFILDIAKDNNVDTLILGAFGCGVFGQDANEVSLIFNDLLNKSYRNVFTNVIFAIPVFNSKDTNYDVFRKNILFKSHK